MNKIIIALAAVAATAGIANADVVSSRYMYGDAPARADQFPQRSGLDYTGTASIAGPAAKDLPISSRYRYGDAPIVQQFTTSGGAASYSAGADYASPALGVSPRAQ